MSDGRRSPQAPPVAGDESVDDGDFYATVSASAGATRSTRIKAPSGTSPEPSSPRPEPTTPRPEPSSARPEPAEGHPHEAFDGPIDAAAKPSVEPAHADDAGASVTEPTTQQAGESTGWRDRWSALAASVSGKTAGLGKGARTGGASSAEPVAEPGSARVEAPTTPEAAPATQPSGAVAYPGTTPPELKPRQTEALAGPSPLVDPPTATIPAMAAAATGTAAVVSTTTAATTAATKPKPGVARRTRKARLRLSRIDPWSVMKTAFLFSIAAGIVLVVAVYVVWTVIGSSGLFSSINEIVGSVVSTPGDTTPFRIEEYVNTQKVMGVTAFVAAIDVVIFTALATLCSFLYNLAATMLGGLEVTLAED